MKVCGMSLHSCLLMFSPFHCVPYALRPWGSFSLSPSGHFSSFIWIS